MSSLETRLLEKEFIDLVDSSNRGVNSISGMQIILLNMKKRESDLVNQIKSFKMHEKCYENTSLMEEICANLNSVNEQTYAILEQLRHMMFNYQKIESELLNKLKSLKKSMDLMTPEELIQQHVLEQLLSLGEPMDPESFFNHFMSFFEICNEKAYLNFDTEEETLFRKFLRSIPRQSRGRFSIKEKKVYRKYFVVCLNGIGGKSKKPLDNGTHWINISIKKNPTLLPYPST